MTDRPGSACRLNQVGNGDGRGSKGRDGIGGRCEGHENASVEHQRAPEIFELISKNKISKFERENFSRLYPVPMRWDARLRRRVRELGWTGAELSRRSGEPAPKVYKYLEGKVKQPRGQTLENIAAAVGLTELELLYGRDEMLNKVPLIGYAGAGETWIAAASDAGVPETIELAIDDADPVAIAVNGPSMEPVYRNRDILIGYRDRGLDLQSALRHDCIIETAEGERYVKILQKGSTPGRFRLRSYNPAFDDIEDVALAWVAPIAHIIRRYSG
ncbi:S24 family peptidase [Amorphus sp. 3PC139-8]|uniref:S24 family peptidase n=1 Tax=Amorphus sp. 3PC139-8 TaxID=2735676 RepID=UPI00345D27A2